MNILVFGKHGQVASEINKKLKVKSLGKKDFNLLNYKIISKKIKSINPDFIINTSSYNFVDKAEINKDEALIINALAPREIAKTCVKMKIPLIHFSTDYVFDGFRQKKYNTNDSVNPLNWYGKTKLIGENYIIKSKCNYNIIRTSWVFSEKKNNFVSKIINNSEKGDLNVTIDEVGCPTPASHLADVCVNIIKKYKLNKFKTGIFHYVGKPCVSRFEFSKIILNKIKSKRKINKINLSDLNLLANRPKNSTLSTNKILKIYKLKQKKWINQLTIIINKMNE